MNFRKLSILIVLLVVSSITIAQSFNLGHTTITFYDIIRNRNIDTEIYYPADNSGDNVPIASGSFPVLVFGHGFLMSFDSYENFWAELVPKGYVLCFPTTEMGFAPNHEDFGLDLKQVALKMQIENNISTSIFFNALAPKTALMGHSMGGGAAFIAAENNPSINSLINFAAAETNPSAISAAGNIIAPALIFTGEDDCVSPPDENQIPMYNNLASSCKTQISINKGGHCYFANYNFSCTFGESSCNPSLDITREQQQTITFDFLNLWLEYSLYDNTEALNIFNDSLQTSNRIAFMQDCNITSYQQINSIKGIDVYPNPTNNEIHITINKNDTGGVLTIFNITGIRVLQRNIDEQFNHYKLSELPSGTYMVIYTNGSVIHSTKFIKTIDSQ